MTMCVLDSVMFRDEDELEHEDIPASSDVCNDELIRLGQALDTIASTVKDTSHSIIESQGNYSKNF